MFGKYSIKYLNDNKDFVLRELTRKSKSYANIKVIKSYVSQLFEIAELLDYIELPKSLSLLQNQKKYA